MGKSYLQKKLTVMKGGGVVRIIVERNIMALVKGREAADPARGQRQHRDRRVDSCSGN